MLPFSLAAQRNNAQTMSEMRSCKLSNAEATWVRGEADLRGIFYFIQLLQFLL